MPQILAWLKARLAEPSTHASLAVVASIAPVLFPQYTAQLQAAAVALSFFGITLPATGAGQSAAVASLIPPVKIANNPALADAINVGVQAAVARLLTPPAK